MATIPSKIKANIDVEGVDIVTMKNMTDEEYREFVRSEGLFLIDNDDVLRSSAAAYPLATNREQLQILADELLSYLMKMVPRGGK